MIRLKSALWVSAHIRRCEAAGAFALVLRRGDEDAGAIFVKIFHGGGQASLYSRSLDDNGDLAWSASYGEPQQEAIIDERIQKEYQMDPDIWVLEIEGCDGRGFLD